MAKKRIIKLTPIMALKIIEELAANESCQFGTDPAKHETPYAKFVAGVYRAAHIGRNPSCKNVHKGWEKDLIKLYKNYCKD